MRGLTPNRYNGAFGVQTDLTTGLLQMRARWYSPGVGRFLSEDPAGFSGGMNWYAYADGNPISRMDPFGLCAESIWNWSLPSASNAIPDNRFSGIAAGYALSAAGSAFNLQRAQPQDPGIHDFTFELQAITSIPGMLRGGFELGVASLAEGRAAYNLAANATPAFGRGVSGLTEAEFSALTADLGTTTLYHGGKLSGGVVNASRDLSTTTELSYAELHATTGAGRTVHQFDVPNSLLKEWNLRVGSDTFKGVTGPEIRIPSHLAPQLNKFRKL